MHNGSMGVASISRLGGGNGKGTGGAITGEGSYGERGSASLYGGLGALPPVGSRGKAPG